MLYLLRACTPEVELTLFQNQLMVSLCVYAISLCVCRRVVVQVCRIVEELYAQYIAKAASEWIQHIQLVSFPGVWPPVSVQGPMCLLCSE